jgi:hypothetical protein
MYQVEICGVKEFFGGGYDVFRFFTAKIPQVAVV